MKKILLILLALLSFAISPASAQTNETTKKSRSVKNAMKFERKLRVDDRMEWEYVVEPSFSGPYSVGCINKKSPKLIATTTVRTFKKSRLFKFSRNYYRTGTSRMRISSSQDSVIAGYFKLANKAAQLRKTTFLDIVFDGTSYCYYINGQPSGTASPSDQTFVYVNQTCDSLYFAIKQKDSKMLERVIDMMQISTEQLNDYISLSAPE
ncbi:MAG: hypothetical protein J6T18_11145 [Bacteroidaceae bacterium]|nr:hypothetical protein [Bacteroidaceae bacterium]